MRMKKFGNTGLVVSELCFGAMTFGGSDGIWAQIASVGQAAADDLVKAAIDGGVNFFDTANVYSAGRSEEILGQSLRNLGVPRDQFVLATKVFGRTGPRGSTSSACRAITSSPRWTPACGACSWIMSTSIRSTAPIR